jgi:hypothetical protein
MIITNSKQFKVYNNCCAVGYTSYVGKKNVLSLFRFSVNDKEMCSRWEAAVSNISIKIEQFTLHVNLPFGLSAVEKQVDVGGGSFVDAFLEAFLACGYNLLTLGVRGIEVPPWSRGQTPYPQKVRGKGSLHESCAGIRILVHQLHVLGIMCA